MSGVISRVPAQNELNAAFHQRKAVADASHSTH
jgi:hypothetical protein